MYCGLGLQLLIQYGNWMHTKFILTLSKNRKKDLEINDIFHIKLI